jgi:hypothetical protein
MKQTVLELTQSILASMDSDEVNSINDTVESYDIALLLRDVYYDIAVELNLTAHESLFELEDSEDVDQPTLMYLPENVQTLWWVKYNNQLISEAEDNSNYIEVEYMNFDDFFKMQNALVFDTTDVGEMTFQMNEEDFEIMYSTDRFPSKYTSVGNRTLLFDAVNTVEDTTLTKEKTMCGGLIYPTFTLEDDFTPTLDASQFPYYRNKAKARAFIEKKQIDNAEANREAKNQKMLMQKRKNRVFEGPAIMTQVARYGRR